MMTISGLAPETEELPLLGRLLFCSMRTLKQICPANGVLRRSAGRFFVGLSLPS